jgi:RHS repeat-associated protein
VLTNTVFVYDAFGKLAAEYSTPSESSRTLYVTRDHLGSTRLLTDNSGAIVKPFDYYPFGEPLSPPVDDPIVRQKFTGKERDNESGLDYFGARYYSGRDGRFTSPDPMLNSGRPDDPRSWSRYAYGLNNPLRFLDYRGLYTYDSSMTAEDRKAFEEALKAARSRLEAIKLRYGATSKEYTSSKRALDAYGRKGVENGVYITKIDGTKSAAEVVSDDHVARTSTNPSGVQSVISFRPDALSSPTEDLAGLVGHEGAHRALRAQLRRPPEPYGDEFSAYRVQGALGEFLRPSQEFSVGSGKVTATLWNPSWTEVDRAISSRSSEIKKFLTAPEAEGGYGLKVPRK